MPWLQSSDPKIHSIDFFSTQEISQRQLLVNFGMVAFGVGAILLFNKKRKKQQIMYTPMPTFIER